MEAHFYVGSEKPSGSLDEQIHQLLSAELQHKAKEAAAATTAQPPEVVREQSRSSVRAQQEWLEANENLSERSEKLSPPGAVATALPPPPEPVVVAAPAPSMAATIRSRLRSPKRQRPTTAAAPAPAAPIPPKSVSRREARIQKDRDALGVPMDAAPGSIPTREV